ncbi:MAG: squalene/phytoene synthase family protein [Xanthomonadales bacterium]|nr:squalene/phytoene synthase family protein [Xanthomonadales bacterium]
MLSITLRFANSDLRDELLILHTVLRAIRAVAFESSQAEPALALLGWWHSELLESSTTTSQHPAIRAMKDCGVLARIDLADLAVFIQSVSELSRGEPIENQDDLINLALRIGGAAAGMEQALGGGRPLEFTRQSGVADFLCWCLQNFDRTLAGECWWLPLDAQAKFGVHVGSFQDQGVQSQRVRAIGLQAGESLNRIRQLTMESPAGDSSSGVCRHLHICAAVNVHRLARLAKNPARYWPLRNSPWDTVVAWRAAREHQRL